MCNAWNHHPGCTCGFGGETAPTEPEIARSRAKGTISRWDYCDDFCRPTTCPECGASVYFVRHNGGSVWLDELGSPWPKHGCFNVTYAGLKITTNIVDENSRLGVVTETEVLEPGVTGRIAIRCNDGSIIDSIFETNWDLVKLVGTLVAIHRAENRLSMVRIGAV